MPTALPSKNCEKKMIRVAKKDAGFVYCILEANEGVAAYTTQPFKKTDLHRDIQLLYTSEFSREMNLVLESLGSLIYEQSK